MLIGILLLVPFFGISQPAEKACFSVPGGFYETSTVLEIFPFYQQHHIRFTTNGNRPTVQSQLYTEPLLLDESLYSTSNIYTIQISPDSIYIPDTLQHCIVIRAAVFDENDSCISPVATNSYFIQSLGCDTHGLPVVSLCADSLDLFDYEHGIFVPGVNFDPQDPNWSGNYYQSGEEWERPSNIEFYELNNEGINQEAGLRTHGGNGRRFQQKCMKLYAREIYGKKRFVHHFFESIPQDSFKTLILKPFVASWNYTGINDHVSNQIAAQLNVESLASRPVLLYLNGEYWGIYYIHERPDEHYLENHFAVDIDNVNIVSSWIPTVDHGSTVSFIALYHWIETADLTITENFRHLETLTDLDNFIDYQILELFLENTDWPTNNMRCWQEGNGKWRWIFFDGDACLRWMTFHTFDNAVYDGDEIYPSSRRATLFFRKLLTNEEFRDRFNIRFHELLNTTFSYDNTGPMFDQISSSLAPEIPFQSARFGIPNDVETWNAYMNHTQWFLLQRCENILPVLDEFISLSLLEVQQAYFEVFPNPSNGVVTLVLDVERQQAVPCLVYDVTGRQVFAQTLSLDAGFNRVSFDLLLSPGLYFMKIGTQSIKIILQ